MPHAAQPSPFSPAGRALIGGLGGFAALASKFLGSDSFVLTDYVAKHNSEGIANLVIGYGILGTVLLFLGALVGWATDGESNRLRLLALGASAPALVASWGGMKPQESPRPPATPVGFNFLVTPAYAQTAAPPQTGGGVGVVQGVKQFFGFPTGQPQLESEAYASLGAEGYVAVGKFTPAAMTFANFDVVTGAAAADGGLPAGAVLKAKTDVYLRENTNNTETDPNRKLGVVKGGGCVAVKSATPNIRGQTWAAIRLVDCAQVR